jgi:tetratricopeptide (TPR) repeat protein
VTIPILFFLGALGFICYRVVFSADATQRLYYLSARRAATNDQVELAKRYFERVGEFGSLSDEMKHDWAIVLDLAGDEKKATKILDEIAPDDSTGLPMAHHTKAIKLTNALNTGDSEPTDSELDTIRSHLEKAIPSARLDQAWADYHVKCGNSEKAVEHLINAVEEFPFLYFSLASLYATLDEPSMRIDSLNSAKSHFKDAVDRDPLDQNSRIAMINALVELGELDEAERAVVGGLQILGTPQWRRITSNFYVQRSEELTADPDIRFQKIAQAIGFDSVNPTVYEEISSFCIGPDVDGSKSALLKVVTGESSVGLAHLCLAYIYWNQKDQANSAFHLDQSARLDSRFGEIASNWAIRLASQETADFDWSMRLIEKCRLLHPDNNIYRIKVAEILLMNSRNSDAISKLEEALDVATDDDRKGILQRISYAYRQLGDLNQSKLFARRAEEADQP